LAEWLLEQQVQEVVMESTAQYWKPVWEALERFWKPVGQKREGARPMTGTLHLAQANRARRGRKSDFLDAERWVKRLVANELTLSFVPDPEQRSVMLPSGWPPGAPPSVQKPSSIQTLLSVV
jgi:transposase